MLKPVTGASPALTPGPALPATERKHGPPRRTRLREPLPGGAALRSRSAERPKPGHSTLAGPPLATACTAKAEQTVRAAVAALPPGGNHAAATDALRRCAQNAGGPLAPLAGIAAMANALHDACAVLPASDPTTARTRIAALVEGLALGLGGPAMAPSARDTLGRAFLVRPAPSPEPGAPSEARQDMADAFALGLSAALGRHAMRPAHQDGAGALLGAPGDPLSPVASGALARAWGQAAGHAQAPKAWRTRLILQTTALGGELPLAQAIQAFAGLTGGLLAGQPADDAAAHRDLLVEALLSLDERCNAEQVIALAMGLGLGLGLDVQPAPAFDALLAHVAAACARHKEQLGEAASRQRERFQRNHASLSCGLKLAAQPCAVLAEDALPASARLQLLQAAYGARATPPARRLAHEAGELLQMDLPLALKVPALGLFVERFPMALTSGLLHTVRTLMLDHVRERVREMREFKGSREPGWDGPQSRHLRLAQASLTLMGLYRAWLASHGLADLAAGALPTEASRLAPLRPRLTLMHAWTRQELASVASWREVPRALLEDTALWLAQLGATLEGALARTADSKQSCDTLASAQGADA